MKNDFTPQEIAEMHDRNENFSGKVADFKKVQLYHEIKKELDDFSKSCDNVIGVDCFELNPDEKNAILWATMTPAVFLDRDGIKQLVSIISKSDHLAFTSSDDTIRIVVGLQDIWEK